VAAKEPCDAISSKQARSGDTPGAERTRTVADQGGVVKAADEFGLGSRSSWQKFLIGDLRRRGDLET
jgi:hypothetical protein